MKDIMFDLETMGTGPNAALVQIGAVRFDFQHGLYFPNEGAPKILIDVSLVDSVSLGGVITRKTEAWWAEQGGFSHKTKPVSVKEALETLFHWVHQSEGGAPRTAWCKGPAFDQAILDFYSAKTGVDLPWAYSQVRDCRTVCKIIENHPNNITNWESRVDPSHQADEDCDLQIKQLLKARQVLGFW